MYIKFMYQQLYLVGNEIIQNEKIIFGARNFVYEWRLLFRLELVNQRGLPHLQL